QNEKYMIKRVIGLPGDKVEFINNKLYINDQEYSESYLNEDTKTDDFSITTFGVDKIPDDKYLVLGDNRSDSLDSRKYGFIDKKNITGKVWFKIFHFKN
nr:signal peptidase I [Bacilli bacterium]